jgi:MarR family transcriptional regulator, lower aerobic nicotinate degradation pathway regulator
MSNSSRQPAPQFPDRTGYLLQRVGRWILRSLERSLAEVGVTPKHVYVLAALSPGSARSQQEIATELGLDRTTTGILLDQLEDRNLVTRQRDPADRRRAAIRLTADGKRVLSRASKAMDAIEDDLLRPLTDAQRQQFADLLQITVVPKLPVSGADAV